MKKCRTFLLLSLVGMLSAVPAAPAHAEWVSTENGQMYTQDAQPGYLTGMKKIGDFTYYFNEQGIMQTGFQTIEEQRYYFNESGQLQLGRFVASDGKTYYASKTYGGALIANKWLGKYYYQADGSMAVNTWVDGKQLGADGRFTGVTRSGIGWVTKNGKKYYYNEQGEMLKGKVAIDGHLYYLDASTGALHTGWFKIGKKYYYANSGGILAVNTWQGGKYLKSTGAAATGWTEIDGVSYLFDSSGNKRNGWTKFKKVYYYCSNGVVQKNKWIAKKYYVLDSGARASGWQTIGTRTFYFDPSSGAKKTGLVKIGAERYYFGTNGRLRTSRWIGGKKYYASTTGALVTGLQNINGSIYLFKTNGKKITNKLKTVNSATYYFKGDGAAVVSSWIKLQSKYYYFQSDGTMAKNAWIDNYYVGMDGVRTDQKKQSGWSTVDGKKYYYTDKGVKATGWMTIEGSKYYFDSTGAAVTGLQTIENMKHYFYSDGRLAVSISLAVGAKKYTIDASGAITAEESIKISGDTVGVQIVNYALQYVGNPYVWGGTSLTAGADCSGFVQTVFAAFGLKLMRVADDQMKGPTGTNVNQYLTPVVVDTSSMLPGDLIFYGDPNYASHVAIYMGDNQIVHASNSQPYPQGGIKISNYDYQTPIRVVRYWS